MIESTELIERWSNAGRVLQAMPAHEREHHWDMGKWGLKTDCGTIVCAAGACGLDAWFRDRGFKLTFPRGSREGKISDVAGFFGLEGSAKIFFDGRARTVDTVLGEVRGYVSQLQRLEALATIAGIPRIGADWAEQGGIFGGAQLGADGAPDYYLIVGPECEPDIAWDDASRWAHGLTIAGHSDFTLPYRREGLPLFDRIRELFQPRAYWLQEQHAEGSSHAWSQYFDDGCQGFWYKFIKLRARAVRRAPIQ